MPPAPLKAPLSEAIVHRRQGQYVRDFLQRQRALPRSVAVFLRHPQGEQGRGIWCRRLQGCRRNCGQLPSLLHGVRHGKQHGCLRGREKVGPLERCVARHLVFFRSPPFVAAHESVAVVAMVLRGCLLHVGAPAKHRRQMRGLPVLLAPPFGACSGCRGVRYRCRA